MNWTEAVELMRQGHTMRRKSESWVKVLYAGDPDDEGIDGAAIVETGVEGCRLMHAWTADERPALVFMGAGSRCLFVPGDEDRSATDWEVEK